MVLEDIQSKKILYIFEYFPPHQLGGAEISGKIRLEKLSKNNKIAVLTPNYDKFKFTKEKKNYLLIKYPSFRYFLYKKRKKISHKIIDKDRNIFFTLLLIFSILSGIEMKVWIWNINRKIGPFDILYGNSIESSIGIALSNIKSKKIAHLRDLVFFERDHASNKLHKCLNNLLKQFIKRLLIKKINQFITISQFMKSEYGRLLGLNPNKIKVVYNEISKDQICELSKNEARKKLMLDKNKKYILFVGSLDKEKGVDFLVEKVAPQIKRSKFLIAGTGYLEKKLRKNLPPNVKMYGFVSNKKIKYFYKAADLVVVPSTCSEAWGRVSSEAQANNTFTIVNDKGGLPETIEKGKGIVVKNENLVDYLKEYFKLKKEII